MSTPPIAAPSPTQPTLARRALYLDVADRLREAIFARVLEPGSWIDELALCEVWGISRTPMREALKVLAAEGLITMKVRRGAYVTEVSVTDVTEVYQLLALLESDAAGEVALNVGAAGRAELAELHQRLESLVLERDAFFRANEHFHRRLLEMAGNRWRLQIVTDLRKVMKLNRHHSLLKAGRVEKSLAEHRALMAAIEAGNAEEATLRMRQHFESGLEAAAPSTD